MQAELQLPTAPDEIYLLEAFLKAPDCRLTTRELCKILPGSYRQRQSDLREHGWPFKDPVSYRYFCKRSGKTKRGFIHELDIHNPKMALKELRESRQSVS